MKTYTLLDRAGRPYQSPSPGTIGGHRRSKVYGRLDCPTASRWIAKGLYVQHRVFFADEDVAIAAGYRPCGHCLRPKYRQWLADRESEPARAPVADGGAEAQRAKTRATRAHQGQVDKAGRPYIEHPQRVVGHLVDPTADEVVVAWLHDVVEDTGVSLQEVETEFGSAVAAAVDALTRRRDEGDHYYARVRANAIALRVKAADLADNTDPARLALLEPQKRADLEAKYTHARHELGIR